MKKIINVFFLMLFTLQNFAQTDTLKPRVSMKENFDAGAIELLKKDGKIYIVIVVICIILFGLFAYLFKLDKKITALEKQK